MLVDHRSIPPARLQTFSLPRLRRNIVAFIERIPYRETRAYVKLVLRNYFYYKRWYNPPTGELTHFDQVASPLIAAVMKSVE